MFLDFVVGGIELLTVNRCRYDGTCGCTEGAAADFVNATCRGVGQKLSCTLVICGARNLNPIG